MLPEAISNFSEATTNHITPYEHIKLSSSISHLQPEAKELVFIIFDSPAGMYDWTANQVTVKPTNLKLYLKEIGWSNSKIKKGFSGVKKMLKEL